MVGLVHFLCFPMLLTFPFVFVPSYPFVLFLYSGLLILDSRTACANDVCCPNVEALNPLTVVFSFLSSFFGHRKHEFGGGLLILLPLNILRRPFFKTGFELTIELVHVMVRAGVWVYCAGGRSGECGCEGGYVHQSRVDFF